MDYAVEKALTEISWSSSRKAVLISPEERAFKVNDGVLQSNWICLKSPPQRRKAAKVTQRNTILSVVALPCGVILISFASPLPLCAFAVDVSVANAIALKPCDLARSRRPDYGTALTSSPCLAGQMVDGDLDHRGLVEFSGKIPGSFGKKLR